MKVKLMDESIKTIIIDSSQTVEHICKVIGNRLGIKSFEEFSLKKENTLESTTTLKLGSKFIGDQR
jgi:hypothetical protein